MYKNLLIYAKKMGHQNVVQIVEYNQYIEKIFDHTEPQLFILDNVPASKQLHMHCVRQLCGWNTSYKLFSKHQSLHCFINLHIIFQCIVRNFKTVFNLLICIVCANGLIIVSSVYHIIRHYRQKNGTTTHSSFQGKGMSYSVIIYEGL